MRVAAFPRSASSRSASSRSAVGVMAALAAVVVLAGCTASESALPAPGPRPTSPFADCPPSVDSPVEPAGRALPELTLACFTTGEPIALAQLPRPAIINFWASWCPPCRKEMPQLQAFADEMGERVLVLGVNTSDGWDAAASAGADFGARYPNLFDPDRRLQAALGLNVLPATIVVDFDGSIVATDVSGALTVEELRTLVSENIGLD